MKICYITNYLPEYHLIWGGAEMACYKLAQGLSSLGEEVSVITNKTIKPPQENFPIIPLERKAERSFRGRVMNKLFKFDYHNPLLTGEAKGILKNLKPQLVHLHNFHTFSLSLLLLLKKMGLPMVVSIYDYYLICPNNILLKEDNSSCRLFHGFNCRRCFKLRQNDNYCYSSVWQRILFRRYLKLVDNFIVLSHNSSQILQDYGLRKEKISVIPLPLYEPEDNLGDIEEGVILFVGWLGPHKGPHIIIEAMPQVIAVVPEARLKIVNTGGGGSYTKKIEQRIAELNLMANVEFFGKLPHREVKELLKKANVVVIPEQWENVAPLILGEAASLEKPIVASRIGGIPEFVETEEFLAIPDDPKDFANKIIYILKNKEAAFRLAKGLKAMAAEKFAVKVVLTKLIALYNELIAKRVKEGKGC